MAENTSEDNTFCINQLVFDRTVHKRLVEGMTGKGGLASILMWLDQLDFVDGLHEKINEISYKLIVYDTALTQCAKEALKRPEFMRQNDITKMLGYSCDECGQELTILGRQGRHCGCGGKFRPTYLLIYRQLREENIVPIPEAVMMYRAYDALADAYVMTYEAFKLALNVIVKQRGWDAAIEFVDYDFKDRLDSSFLYDSAGDLRISREERECLMFMIRGILVDIPVREATKLLHLGLMTCKYGHLFNQLYCSGAEIMYNEMRANFTLIYNHVNSYIRQSTAVSKKERTKRTVEITEYDKKLYFGALLLPKPFWLTGKLASHIVLQPIPMLPVYTQDRFPAVNGIVGSSGCGKTSLMASIICESFERKHELVMNILGDEANSLTLAGLPMFHCGGDTGYFLKRLEEMNVKPHGLPIVNLTFLREEEQIEEDLLPANPPTVWDYIVEIDDPASFGLDFENSEKTGIIDKLALQASDLGYKRVCGIVNVRNLSRIEAFEAEKGETNIDVVVATQIIQKFDSYRQSHKQPSARLNADEASYLAPLMHTIAGSDTSKSSSALAKAAKRVRKINCSFDLGTQKYGEINSDVRAELTNIFFRELPKQGDRSRSQRAIVLDSLSLKEGKALQEIVSNAMESGEFPYDDYYWFMWNKFSKDVEVVKPQPSFFMLNQPKHTNVEVFKAYEKLSGKKVLRKSWSDVPRLRYKNKDYFAPTQRRAY